jgi:hypothetical protein
MDFNRSGQARPTSTSPTPAQATQKPTGNEPAAGNTTNFKHSTLYRLSFLALLVSGTVLFIAMIFFIVFGTPVNREAQYVNKDQYQAVFVNVNGTNGGQVYFGHVASLTPQYIRLTNVFYIQNQQAQSSQSATDSSYNLVKLGCELHGPLDEMLINRSQVFFWENLKSDSQVAQKAAEFYKQNPNGQKCSTNSGSTQQSNTNTQTPATPTTTPAATQTPAATTKKP